MKENLLNFVVGYRNLQQTLKKIMNICYILCITVHKIYWNGDFKKFYHTINI